jgi:hypothetical protein
VDVVGDCAPEQAEAVGERPAARRRHAVVFARLAVRTAPRLAGGELAESVARLDDVAGDLWAALAHAADDDPPTGLRLAASLPGWWRFRGRDVAGRRWLRRLLDDPRGADADPAVRAWAGVGAAGLALEHGAGAEELAGAEDALAAFQRLGDVSGELAARGVLCAVCREAGQHDRARRHAEAALALAGRAGRPREAARAQLSLSWHDIRAGDLAAARQRLAAVDRLYADGADDRLRAAARAELAEVARLEGRHEEAEAVARPAAALLEELGDVVRRRRALGTLGLALAQAGRSADAVALLDDLRADGSAESEAACAAIEAYVAAARGDRRAAAELFAAAARGYAGGADPREAVEFLVGALAATEDPAARGPLTDRLAAACADGGVALLPHERAVAEGGAGGRVPRQRRPEQARVDSD